MVGGWTLPTGALAQEINLNGTLTSAAAQKRTGALCTAARGLVHAKIEPAQARRLYLRAINTGADDVRCATTGLKGLTDRKKAAATSAAAGAAGRARALLKNGFAD